MRIKALPKRLAAGILLVAFASVVFGAATVVPPPSGQDTVQDAVTEISKNFLPADIDLGSVIWTALVYGQTEDEYLDQETVDYAVEFARTFNKPTGRRTQSKRSELEKLIDFLGRLLPDFPGFLREKSQSTSGGISSIALGRELVTVILNTSTIQILADGGVVNTPQAVDFYSYDRRLLATIPLDEDLTSFVEPLDMAISSDNRSVVVAVRGSDPTFDPDSRVASHLAILDIERIQRAKRIYLPATDWPVGLALSPDDQLAYVSAQHRTNGQIDGAAILVVELENGTIVDRVDLPFAGGSGPGEIVITPDGALLFVLSGREFIGPTSAPGVTVVDTRTGTITATIGGIADSTTSRALGQASQIAVDPTGTRVYVADALTPQSPDDFTTVGIGVIDTATATLTRLIPIPGAVRGGIDDLQVSTDGRSILHADGVSGLVTAIDPTTFEIQHQVQLDGPMGYLSIAVGP
jgi:DNA-binding beta-propeller fold protein YncE